jgi:hypothetical protein
VKEKLKYWMERMEIYKDVRFKKVRRSQFTWDDNRHEHVWCVTKTPDKDGIYWFYYTKEPSEKTIIHELLHIKFPSLGESTVRKLTNIILY